VKTNVFFIIAVHAKMYNSINVTTEFGIQSKSIWIIGINIYIFVTILPCCLCWL